MNKYKRRGANMKAIKDIFNARIYLKACELQDNESDKAALDYVQTFVKVPIAEYLAQAQQAGLMK